MEWLGIYCSQAIFFDGGSDGDNWHSLECVLFQIITRDTFIQYCQISGKPVVSARASASGRSDSDSLCSLQRLLRADEAALHEYQIVRRANH
jgi:hypothetical protein